jgi:hypothetical protein
MDYAGDITNGGIDLAQANLSPVPASDPPQGEADLTSRMNITRAGEFELILSSKF